MPQYSFSYTIISTICRHIPLYLTILPNSPLISSHFAPISPNVIIFQSFSRSWYEFTFVLVCKTDSKNQSKLGSTCLLSLKTNYLHIEVCLRHKTAKTWFRQQKQAECPLGTLSHWRVSNWPNNFWKVVTDAIFRHFPDFLPRIHQIKFSSMQLVDKLENCPHVRNLSRAIKFFDEGWKCFLLMFLGESRTKLYRYWDI